MEFFWFSPLQKKEKKKQKIYFFFPFAAGAPHIAAQLGHLLGTNNLTKPPNTNNTAAKVTQPSTPSHRGHTQAFNSNSTPVTSFIVPWHLLHIHPIIITSLFLPKDNL